MRKRSCPISRCHSCLQWRNKKGKRNRKKRNRERQTPERQAPERQAKMRVKTRRNLWGLVVSRNQNRSTRGSISVQFLVILVPVVLGMMGFAVDLGRLY